MDQQTSLPAPNEVLSQAAPRPIEAPIWFPPVAPAEMVETLQSALSGGFPMQSLPPVHTVLSTPEHISPPYPSPQLLLQRLPLASSAPPDRSQDKQHLTLHHTHLKSLGPKGIYHYRRVPSPRNEAEAGNVLTGITLPWTRLIRETLSVAEMPLTARQISERILAKFPDYNLHLLYVRSRIQTALTGSGRVNWMRVTPQRGSTAGTWRIRTVQEMHNIRYQLNKDEQD